MEESHPFVIIGLGEVQWDVLSDDRQLGGAPASVVYHAQALGARGVIASSVGQDPGGQELLAAMTDLGLAIGVVHLDPARPTAEVQVSLDAHGSPGYEVPELAAWDYLPFRPECAKLARKADAICFGTLASRNPHSRDCIRKFLQSAVPGCLRVFDVNLRQKFYSRDLLQDLLEHTEVLKLNEDELPIVSGLLNIGGSTKDRMEALMDKFALDAIALTRGARGSVLMSPSHLEVHHGHRVDDVENTLGASDAFTAMLVMGLLHEWPLSEISERANRLASHVCTMSGAMTAHPQLAVV
jgi:fructokinase